MHLLLPLLALTQDASADVVWSLNAIVQPGDSVTLVTQMPMWAALAPRFTVCQEDSGLQVMFVTSADSAGKRKARSGDRPSGMLQVLGASSGIAQGTCEVLLPDSTPMLLRFELQVDAAAILPGSKVEATYLADESEPWSMPSPWVRCELRAETGQP